MALTAKRSLTAQPTEDMRQQILQTALCKGFWSVWMTVFADDSQMRQMLLQGFPGTAWRECFDSAGNPIHRPDGQI
jgi:inosine/xanthosine triphosphate pyrophosphatase family protein